MMVYLVDSMMLVPSKWTMYGKVVVSDSHKAPKLRNYKMVSQLASLSW